MSSSSSVGGVCRREHSETLDPPTVEPSPWLAEARAALALAEEARANGCPTVSLAAAILAAQCLQLARLFGREAR